MDNITQDGREFEYRGETRLVRQGDHFISGFYPYAIEEAYTDFKTYPKDDGIRAIVYPVVVTHTFGGVVFEEIGEVRSPRCGEFFLYKGMAYTANLDYQATQYSILRPVRMEA